MGTGVSPKRIATGILFVSLTFDNQKTGQYIKPLLDVYKRQGYAHCLIDMDQAFRGYPVCHIYLCHVIKYLLNLFSHVICLLHRRTAPNLSLIHI